MGLAALCDLKICIESEQVYGVNGKRPSSESFKVGYMLIIENFLTLDLNMFILTTKLFFQIHINRVVFRYIFYFLTEARGGIFMGPGMLDMHYH